MASLVEQLCSHPSLCHPQKLSSDIFPPLFGYVFEHPVFVRWSGEHVNWQLCCVGAPGAGKTTLAALVNKHLSDRFLSAGCPVISIFVRGDVAANENEFLESFINTIYKELGDDGDSSKKSFDVYLEARFRRDEGCSIDRRLNLLRDALHRRVRSRRTVSRVFLIVDGLDLCSRPFSALLNTELSGLRSAGISVLITTRIAPAGKVPARCDHPKHTNYVDQSSDDEGDKEKEGDQGEGENDDEDDEEEPLSEYDRQNEDMYYTCEQCLSILCLYCKAKGRACESEACAIKSPMRELYDQVDINLSTPHEEMEAYIAWNLEREHGDLGLNSSARKPPLSPLGLSIRKNKDPELARHILQDVKGRAHGHIGIAKARLDLVHDALSAEQTVKKHYQLPANIVIIFDAVIKTVETQDPIQRSLGLHSIAAAASDYHGIETSVLRELLEKIGGKGFGSEEDVLRASRGLLTAPPPFRDDEQQIRISDDTFYNYAVERYNESIHLAGLHLPQMVQIDDMACESPSQMVSEEPISVVDFGTQMESLEEQDHSHFAPYIIRQGTRPWL